MWLFLLSNNCEQPFSRGGTHRQQLFTNLAGELEVTVTLQGWHQFGQERYQAFRTDEVCGRPGNLERILNRLTVPACARPPNCRRKGRWLPQQPNGVLALIPCRRHELIQDQRLLSAAGLAVAQRYLCQQLAPGLKAHHGPHSLPSLRSLTCLL